MARAVMPRPRARERWLLSGRADDAPSSVQRLPLLEDEGDGKDEDDEDDEDGEREAPSEGEGIGAAAWRIGGASAALLGRSWALSGRFWCPKRRQNGASDPPLLR